MHWLFLALGSAFFSAFSDALAKSLSRQTSTRLLVWMRFFSASLWLLLLWPLADPDRHVDQVFWLLLVIVIPLEFAAAYSFNHALTLEDLSLAVPLAALTPLFLLVIPRIMLGEKLTMPGTLGVLCVVAGAYLLNASGMLQDPLSPLRAIWQSRGARFAVLAAAIYAITSTLGKMMIQHSSATLMAAAYYPIVSLAITPFVLPNEPEAFSKIKNNTWKFLLLGASIALSASFHFYAIAKAPVAYMIAVKRSSMIFAIFYGWRFYRERNLASRFCAALIMLAGIFLIARG